MTTIFVYLSLRANTCFKRDSVEVFDLAYLVIFRYSWTKGPVLIKLKMTAFEGKTRNIWQASADGRILQRWESCMKSPRRLKKWSGGEFISSLICN